ncbi:NUDIX hydrolase [Thiospirillum jenense]|uniref:GDP-mannose pyrophosphatase n=1 Tax=Thiospirillum jenense TaxID=1653858 RepID=A0A839H6J4_9GAMM|nr:NUDIX hydrolase [Thiospirillum jenense]MBB1125385.1 NUDIX hydrolase [Thiospirillum jenense]
MALNDTAPPAFQTLIYQGKVVTLALETVQLPTGQRVELEIVHHPGGAAVVALDAQLQLCLLRQYRHAGGGWLWELPAGKRDDGEPPLQTAQRELAEEAGITAAQWSELGWLHSSPGVFDEVIYVYLARDLTPTAMAHGSGEVIEVHWLPLVEVWNWCQNGQITDAKTLIGICRTVAHLQICQMN